MQSTCVFNRIVRAVLLACVIHVSVYSQQPATISGFVADPSGAGVPGASLTLTNQDTAVTVITTKSDANGDFAFQAVPAPGTYSISIQVGGFTRHEQKDVAVTAGERRSVGTVSLAVGSITDSVTVLADTTPVQTSSAERSASIDRHEIGALLARGLNYGSLIRSLPGVSGGVDPNGPGGNTTIYASINGTRASSTIPTIDGVNAADPSSQGQLYAAAATDSLVEINVKTSNYQAEYGGSAGAVINLVTRSGSKDFHGGVYTYLRNEALNANTFFNNRNGAAKPIYRYAIGGGSIGGPVPIPGKLKNKVFFFFNDQYSYQGNPGALQRLTMPTELERKGDFSKTVTPGSNPTLIPVYRGNTGTRVQYPGNVIPASEFNAYGQKILNFFPLPNYENRAITTGQYNFLYQNTPKTRRNEYTYRLDFQLTDKLRLYGRNNQINNNQEGFSIGVLPGPPWGLVKGFYSSHSTTPSINLVYTISPTLINDLTFGVNHWNEPGGPLDDAELAKAQRATYGLQGLGQWYPSANAYDYLPIMSFSDVPSAGGFSYDSRTPISGATTIFTLSDNITKVYGKHTFKAGVVITRSRGWKGNQGSAFSGNFAFGRQVNNPLDTNYGYANALLGIFDSYTESSARPGADFRSGAFEEYAQDSWKVNRRLTLEFGIRLTSWIPWHQRSNIQSGFDPASWNPANASRLFAPGLAGTTRVAVNPVTGAQLPAVYIGAIVPGVGSVLNGMLLAGDPGVPTGLTKVQRITPGPRFGFAYDLFGDGKTALRGGFGISTLPQSQIDTNLQNQPPNNYTPRTFYGTLNTFQSVAGTLFPSNVKGTDWSQLAQSYSFSLGAQREVGFATVVDVAFVGNLGRHLLQSQQLNTLPYGKRFLPSSLDPTTGRPLPDSFLVTYAGLGNVQYAEPVGSSSYYALQAQANRRFSHGLEFKANWTWSRSMDYGSGDNGNLPLFADRKLIAYGLSNFDRTFITNFAGLYEIPGARHLSNPVAKMVLGNWNVSATITLASGAPSGVGFSTVQGTDLIGGGDGQRINVNGNPNLGYGTRNGDRFFDTSVFSLPALGSIGSAGRQVFRGPGQNQWDLAAFKDFGLGHEKVKIQIRSEFYNAFNHTQWSSIDTTARFDIPTGRQTNTLFGTATGDRGVRVVQLALRVSF